MTTLSNAQRRRRLQAELPLARSSDPRTSKQGEEYITDSGKRLTHKQRLLAAIELYPGKTAREYGQLLGIDGAWKWVSELEATGSVAELDVVQCSITNRPARTWRVTGRGDCGTTD